MRVVYFFLIVGLISACGSDKKDQERGEKTALFTELKGEQTQIRFKNIIPENERMNSLTYEYYYNGGGVAVGDVNNDGLPDLYLTGNVTPNKLYLNQGNFKFKDITEVTGLKDSPSWTTGTTMVDINQDGILDIYVCRSGKLDEAQRRNLFFVSVGMKNALPIYKNQAEELGLDDPAYSTQAAFFDYDRDGDVDVFLLNHNVEVQPYYELEELKKKRDPLVGDKLFKNENGKFIDVSAQAGIHGNEIGYGLGVSMGDLNNDGWPDIYVANDYSEHDYVYINNQDGTFSEQSQTSLMHQSNYSMGSDIQDINNDGWLDIMVLDMVAEDNYGIKTSMSGMSPERFQTHLDNGLQYQYMYNTLQLNRGEARFSEVGQLAGVHSTDWSWAPLLVDIDLDGHKDLFVTNGLKRDFRNNDYRKYKIKRLAAVEGKEGVDKAKLIKELVNLTPQKKLRNYVFQNQGNLRFENKQDDWGIVSSTYSNGLAYADFDGDGDLDFITNNIDEEPILYKNNTQEIHRKKYLKVSFKGSKENPGGIGARVKIWYQGQQQTQEHYLTRGYQSSVAPNLTFGLDQTNLIDSVKIDWSDGKTQILNQIASNQTLVADYEEAVFSERVGKAPQEVELPNIPFVHQEKSFNDFERESLLPHKMSELGPGLTVADINKDGLEDVFICGAKGFSGSLFLQNSLGEFEMPAQNPWQKYSASEEVSALFFDANGDGWPDLYVVSGSNEFEEGAKELQDHLYINDHGDFVDASHLLPGIGVSGKAVAAADFDEDGDLDLFVGGRQKPGLYPYPESSYLLENQNGKFVDRTSAVAPEMTELGMVTDAAWIDYDLSGTLDLIIVGEWMPLTIFSLKDGKFIKHEVENSTGWWNSIAAADFDKDGDLDLVLGNNGLNYKYKATQEEPFSVYADDFDQNGSTDIVLGYYNNQKQFPLRGRECSSNQMPFIKKKFPTYHDFGQATLQEVYDHQNLANALQYHVKTFATSYAGNLGNGDFTIMSLPVETQFSATNTIVIEDVNADGSLDILLAGNLYQSEVETPRNDASFGAILLGNGQGQFEYFDHLGLNIDIRSMSLIRLTDQSLAIVVSSNQGPVKILKLPF
ncbi:MAG: VCBS repeat-containing protein [Reichenbachiella sp.]|uniref:VCBS repeat-containing protein n=1 Tax=Reichenbachiella sp. TaxID=2184521 RepID=UPI0029662BE6|nr:VCBS repeat-containing protein [Reichenbachiella sp.]MDW3211462.1 VCBS repeat-containing protein [Reichenbachiella sp.]